MADVLNYNLAVPRVDDAGVLSALVAEGDDLDVLVTAVDDWSGPTPAPGWTVAHQIAHLAWADSNALSAMRTPDAFDAELARAEAEGSGYADKAATAGAAKPRSVLLDEWRAGRAELAAVLRDTPWDHAFPWYMSKVTPALMVPLRLMETWAHGQDVFDAVGAARRPTGRLQHVASLGVLGRGLSFAALGLPEPAGPFRIELAAPDGQTWVWGPEAATQRVQGSARDFCLCLTRRRPWPETDMTATGEDAQKWLKVARVFL
ncbi:TIGR03084 family metal-binding protein [Streptomyces sp. SID3343]|uniref:TIGR03084 family metal-binding protein n=1 Tax=Streptomyces sp. SID3343 TaxID=2690260 RepID=UPI00136FC087|nr:TIGR03084 family metal-binding protein [Streptomyces sp. SID3343]MYW06724.1 TIGR03084 family protein [Streptomyces sp. SID3343]